MKRLHVFERILRNMPPKKIKQGYEDTPLGRVYLGWGRGSDGWYGGFAVDVMGGLAVAMNKDFFKDEEGDDFPEQEVKQALYEAGASTYNDFRSKGLV